VIWIKAIGQGEAPEEVEEYRREIGTRGSPTGTNFTEEACRLAEFRRRITRWLVDDSGEKQREMREGVGLK
jgi:hypothetical protein